MRCYLLGASTVAHLSIVAFIPIHPSIHYPSIQLPTLHPSNYTPIVSVIHSFILLLLRYNSHTIKVTFLKHTWLLIYSQSGATITPIYFENTSQPPKEAPYELIIPQSPKMYIFANRSEAAEGLGPRDMHATQLCIRSGLRKVGGG